MYFYILVDVYYSIGTYRKVLMREYFYKENGKTKRYYYCSLCGAGPFQEYYQGYDYLELGTDKTPINYCRKCSYEKGHTSKLLKERPVHKGKIEKIIPIVIPKVQPQIEDEIPYVDVPKEPIVLSSQLVSKSVKSSSPLISGHIEEILFLIVKCKDETIYTSVSGLGLKKAIKYMDTGKGPDYTKPYERRPVTLLYNLKVKDKEIGKIVKKEFESWDIDRKNNFINDVNRLFESEDVKKLKELSGVEELDMYIDVDRYGYRVQEIKEIKLGET